MNFERILGKGTTDDFGQWQSFVKADSFPGHYIPNTGMTAAQHGH